MSDGVPGGDRDDLDDDGSLGGGLDELILRWFVLVLKIGLFAAVPPIYLHRDDPIRGLWRWRRVYLVFLVGTGLVFLPSVLTGDFGVLALFPVFHLIVAGLLGEVLAVTMMPTFAPSVSIPSFAAVPLRAEAVAVAVAALAVVVVARRGLPSIPSLDGMLGRSVGADDGEYIVLITEVWKSGGKHD